MKTQLSKNFQENRVFFVHSFSNFMYLYLKNLWNHFDYSKIQNLYSINIILGTI